MQYEVNQPPRPLMPVAEDFRTLADRQTVELARQRQALLRAHENIAQLSRKLREANKRLIRSSRKQELAYAAADIAYGVAEKHAKEGCQEEWCVWCEWAAKWDASH